MALTDFETKWVKRAHRMLNDKDHIERTRDLGGSPAGLEPDPRATELRWPGYLGPDAVPGEAVLMIANVHRDFGSGGLQNRLGKEAVDVVGDLMAGTYNFKNLDRSIILEGARDYLTAVGNAYEAGLAPGGWGVGTYFRKGLEACSPSDGEFSPREEIRRAVYMNASCAQLPGTLKWELANECLRRHGLDEVLKLVQPRAILCSSLFAFDQIVALGWDKKTPTTCFNQLNGTITRTCVVGDREVEIKTPALGGMGWLAALRELFP